MGVIIFIFPRPNRKAMLCQYKHLVQAEEMIKVTDIKDELTSFAKFTQRALLPYQEQKLVEALEEMIRENNHLTPKIIASRAKEAFNDSEHLGSERKISRGRW